MIGASDQPGKSAAITAPTAGYRLPDRILVTGAAGDIGGAICRALVKAGCAVVATDLKIPADADGAEWVAADLATEEGRADVVRVASSSPLGGIVCAAGVIDAAPWDRVSPGDIDRILSVNAIAPFLLVRDLIPALAPPASVVLVGSVAGLRAVPDAAAYAASKAALRSFSATLAVAVADRGIRVNTLAPGLIDTAMTDTLNGRLAVRAGTGADEIARARATSIPAGRAGTPEELVGACLWLLGDGATYVSGATLVAAGGVLAGTA